MNYWIGVKNVLTLPFEFSNNRKLTFLVYLLPVMGVSPGLDLTRHSDPHSTVCCM